MENPTEKILDYLLELKYYKLVYPDESELKHFSYGRTAIEQMLDIIEENPTARVSSLIEKRIHDLNKLCVYTKNEEIKYMCGAQIDFLTDIYDQLYL